MHPDGPSRLSEAPRPHPGMGLLVLAVLGGYAAGIAALLAGAGWLMALACVAGAGTLTAGFLALRIAWSRPGDPRAASARLPENADGQLP